MAGALWSGRVAGKEPTPEDGQSIREVDIQLDPSQAQISVYFSPIQQFIMGGDRYKQLSRTLRSLMDLPAEKSRKSKSKSKSKAKATVQPLHVVFDIRANGDVVVPAQN